MGKITIITLTILLSFSLFVSANQGPPPHPMHHEVIKEYRNLRLLNELQLTEEESEKILPILNDMYQGREKMFAQENSIMQKIENELKGDADSQQLTKLNEKYLELLVENYKTRKRNIEKLQKNLNPEKFSHYLLFERQFGKKLRNRIMEMHKKLKQ